MASPQHVVVQVPATASSTCCTNTQEQYATTTSKALGILQMIGGVMAIICQCVLIGVSSAGGYSGAGIWCGIMVGNWFKQYFISNHPTVYTVFRTFG